MKNATTAAITWTSPRPVPDGAPNTTSTTPAARSPSTSARAIFTSHPTGTEPMTAPPRLSPSASRLLPPEIPAPRRNPRIPPNAAPMIAISSRQIPRPQNARARPRTTRTPPIARARLGSRPRGVAMLTEWIWRGVSEPVEGSLRRRASRDPTSLYRPSRSRRPGLDMAEEKKLSAAQEKRLSAAEVRRTIATSLATAFGFVIGLLWNNVVTGGLKVAGIDTTFPTITPTPQTLPPVGWAGYVVAAVVLTVVMVLLIILFSRWGSK